MDAHANFSYSTVLTAPSPAASGTSLVVQSGDGAKFPAVPFNATVWPAGAQPTTTNAEIVRVTARSTDTLTITRAQESSSARTIVVGDQIAATITAKTFTDIETDLASADTQIALQSAQIAAQSAAALGFYVGAGGALTVNGVTPGSSAARLDLAVASDVFGTVDLGIPAATAQQGLATGNSTTVASGSNTVHTNTFAGAGVLSVASVSGFPTSGTLMVTNTGGTLVSVITYTNVSGSTFTGCTLANGVDVTMATSNTVVGSNADITNPRWAAIELTSAGAYNVNLGTAAASPAFPTPTASRVVHGWLFIPANATSIDALLTTPNGNAKLIDARVVKPGPSPTGWQYDQNTWVFSSSTTGAGGGFIAFTVTGVDATGYLKPGTKVSWDDGTNVPGYGVVATSTFSTNTTVSLIGQSDYVMANATIKYARYSTAAIPIGFPPGFNWSPTLSGWSSNPTNTVYRWQILTGTRIQIEVRQLTAGTSNNASHTGTLPVTAKTISNMVWQVATLATDNGTAQTGLLQVQSAGTTALFIGIIATSTNTNSGSSRFNGGELVYEF